MRIRSNSRAAEAARAARLGGAEEATRTATVRSRGTRIAASAAAAAAAALAAAAAADALCATCAVPRGAPDTTRVRVARGARALRRRRNHAERAVRPPPKRTATAQPWNLQPAERSTACGPRRRFGSGRRGARSHAVGFGQQSIFVAAVAHCALRRWRQQRSATLTVAPSGSSTCVEGRRLPQAPALEQAALQTAPRNFGGGQRGLRRQIGRRRRRRRRVAAHRPLRHAQADGDRRRRAALHREAQRHARAAERAQRAAVVRERAGRRVGARLAEQVVIDVQMREPRRAGRLAVEGVLLAALQLDGAVKPGRGSAILTANSLLVVERGVPARAVLL